MLRWFGRNLTPEQQSISDLVNRTFHFKPSKMGLYELALTHSSAGKKDVSGFKLNNERLEFLGDAIIDSVLAHYLFDNHPGMTEGELTKMKSKIVSRKSLNRMGEVIGLDQYIVVNLGKQELNRSMLGNAFEAIVGAVYLEKGYAFTYKVLVDFFRRHDVDHKVLEEIDHKSKLHEWCQKHRKTLEFVVVEETQTKGMSSFTVEVRVDRKECGRGWAKSKKHAEQEASRQACETLIVE